MISEKTFLVYQEQAEGLIKDQNRMIAELRQKIKDLSAALDLAIKSLKDLGELKPN